METKNVFTNFVIRLKEQNSKNKSDTTFKKLAKDWALNYVYVLKGEICIADSVFIQNYPYLHLLKATIL